MSLAEVASSWRPSEQTTDIRFCPHPAMKMLRLLDGDGDFQDGDAVPPLWHWVYFVPMPSQRDLGEDGHPATDQFLPPLRARRRMMAGGSLAIERPFVIGEDYRRTTGIEGVTLKEGSSGPLLFVRLRHTFHDSAGLVATELEQAVYREPRAQELGSSAVSGPTQGAKMSDIAGVVLPTDATLLFRFSALTNNAHRIHYDRPYAVNIERHPELVVQGPLIAVTMLEVARKHSDRAVANFEYRLASPLYCGQPIIANASPLKDGWQIRVEGNSTAAAIATVGFA
jgi:3-methylfumaryl-CoA hydratase